MWKKIKDIIIQVSLCFLCSLFCFNSWSMDSVSEVSTKTDSASAVPTTTCAFKLINNDNIPDHFTKKLEQFFNALLQMGHPELGDDTKRIIAKLKLLSERSNPGDSSGILNLDLSNSYIMIVEEATIDNDRTINNYRFDFIDSSRLITKDNISLKEIFQNDFKYHNHRPQFYSMMRIGVISVFPQDYMRYISSLNRTERQRHLAQLIDDLDRHLKTFPDDAFDVLFEKIEGHRFQYLTVSGFLLDFGEEILDISDGHYRNTAYVLGRSIDDIRFVYRSPVSGNDRHNTDTVVR